MKHCRGWYSLKDRKRKELETGLRYRLGRDRVCAAFGMASNNSAQCEV